MNKKIYLAGPEVFSPNAPEIIARYQKICQQYGFIGLSALDNENKGSNPTSASIFNLNVENLQTADYVIANLNPFRGNCTDDGTSWEIGYAYALGIKIFGYISDASSMCQKFSKVDESGFRVEDFDQPVNLMLAESIYRIVEGSFETCISALNKFDKAFVHPP